MFLDGVVNSLNQHAGQVGPLQQVWHGGTVSEGVHCPSATRGYTYNSMATMLTFRLAIQTDARLIV